MTGERKTRKPKRHWYFISVWACVLCGRTRETRERRFTLRPTDPTARREYIEDACGCHFA